MGKIIRPVHNLDKDWVCSGLDGLKKTNLDFLRPSNIKVMSAATYHLAHGWPSLASVSSLSSPSTGLTSVATNLWGTLYQSLWPLSNHTKSEYNQDNRLYIEPRISGTTS